MGELNIIFSGLLIYLPPLIGYQSLYFYLAVIWPLTNILTQTINLPRNEEELYLVQQKQTGTFLTISKSLYALVALNSDEL